MAFDELAQRLFGARRAESDAILTDATTGTIHGVALTDSEGGAVTVEITADVTAPEPLEVGGETYFADAGVGVEIPTSESVRAGDEVLVSTYGAGTMRSPVVTAAVGSGDRMAAAVQDAHDLAASVESIAQEAKDVAEATGQHFWPDTDGVHVTEVTQDEWSDSTGTSYHSGANVLINALGQLFRDGLNNILAIVSGTDPGIAIYDGEGNAADNILALLTKSLIRLGGKFAANGRSTAKVQFFEDDSALTDLTAEHYIDTTTEPQVSHDLALSATTTDDELPDGTSRTVTGNVEVWEQIYNDGTDYSDQVDVSLNGATTNRQYNASVGVSVIEASGGQVERTAFAVADNLRLTYGTGEQATVSDVAMRQAIVSLTRPMVTRSPANAANTNTLASGWHAMSLPVQVSENGNFSQYMTLAPSTGTFTALVGCTVMVSGQCTWLDGIVGNSANNRRGIGFFENPTVSSTGAVSGGTEHGASNLFSGSGTYLKGVALPPLVLHVNAGSNIVAARWEPLNAINDGRYGLTWVNVEIIGVD